MWLGELVSCPLLPCMPRWSCGTPSGGTRGPRTSGSARAVGAHRRIRTKFGTFQYKPSSALVLCPKLSLRVANGSSRRELSDGAICKRKLSKEKKSIFWRCRTVRRCVAAGATCIMRLWEWIISVPWCECMHWMVMVTFLKRLWSKKVLFFLQTSTGLGSSSHQSLPGEGFPYKIKKPKRNLRGIFSKTPRI